MFVVDYANLTFYNNISVIQFRAGKTVQAQLNKHARVLDTVLWTVCGVPGRAGQAVLKHNVAWRAEKHALEISGE